MSLWRKTTFDVYIARCLGHHSLVVWFRGRPYTWVFYREKCLPSFHWLAMEYLRDSGIHWSHPDYKRIQGLIKGFARRVKDVEYTDYKTM